MHWLSKQPAWGRSREFEITTRAAGRQGMLLSSNEEDVIDSEDEEGEDDDALVHGRRKKKVAFLPSFGKSGHMSLFPSCLLGSHSKKSKISRFCASWSGCIYVFSDVVCVCVCAGEIVGGLTRGSMLVTFFFFSFYLSRCP